MLTVRLLENDSKSEEKSRNSTQVILAVIQSEDLINKIASYLGPSDYANLKASSIKLHGTIKIPNYAIRYAERGIDAAESFCFIGGKPKRPQNYEAHISAQTQIDEIACVTSCGCLVCACCISRYTLSLLFGCAGFFAGSIKKNFCSGIRDVGPSLLLPPSDKKSDAGPKQQSM